MQWCFAFLLLLTLHSAAGMLYPSLGEVRECKNLTTFDTNAAIFTASRHLYHLSAEYPVVKWLLGADSLVDETLVTDSVSVPRGIAVDEATGAVAIQDSLGTITVWTSPTTSTEIRTGHNSISLQPRYLVLRDGYLYFVARNQIMKIPMNGSSPEEVVAGRDTTSGTDDDQFDRPQGHALDKAGNLYVVDKKNVRVMKWLKGASTGTLVAGRLGESATNGELDLLNGPSGIRVDDDDNLYIVERSNKRIVVWAPGASTGAVLWNFTETIWEMEFDRMGGFFVATKVGMIWCSTTSTTTSSTTTGSMTSTTTDSTTSTLTRSSTSSGTSTRSGTSTSSATLTNTRTSTSTLTMSSTLSLTSSLTSSISSSITSSLTSTSRSLTSSASSTTAQASTTTGAMTSSAPSTASNTAGSVDSSVPLASSTAGSVDSSVPLASSTAGSVDSSVPLSSSVAAARSTSPAFVTSEASSPTAEGGSTTEAETTPKATAEAQTHTSVPMTSAASDGGTTAIAAPAASTAAASTASSTASTSESATTTRTASYTAPVLLGVPELLQWLDAREQRLLAELGSQPNASNLKETASEGASMQAFRMRPEDGDLSFPVAGTEVVVTLPASLLTSLNLSSVLGVATVFEPSLLAAFQDRDEEGAVVELVQSGVDMKLYSEEGRPLAVSGLLEPVALSLPVQDRRAVCAYWHEDRELWSYQGLEDRRFSGHGQGLRCLSRHLTFFGAIIKGFVMALVCAQLELLNLEALRQLASAEWFATPVAVLYWLVLLALAAMMLAARIRDRATAHLWNDEFFLIPRYPRRQESFAKTESQKSEAFSLRACVAAPCNFCLSSAWRDVLDEIASRWFSFFGETRSFCESVCGGLELRSVSARALVQKLTASLVSNTARRQACTSLGLSADLVTFVTDDEQLGKLLLEAALETQQGEDGASAASPRAKAAWLKLHTMVIAEIHGHWDAPSSWRKLLPAMGRLFLMSNPLSAAFSQCYFQTRCARVMLLSCELLGAFMLSCIFFEASGGVASKKNDQRECEAQGVWEQAGQLAAFAVASLLLAALPVLLISSLQSRGLRKLDYVGCEGWQRQLISWRMQDRLFWATASLYLAFSAFFVALFLANVGLEDHSPFGISACIQLLEDMLVIPIGMAMLLPTFSAFALGLASYLQSIGSKELVMRCRAEREGLEGNWHQVILDI